MREVLPSSAELRNCRPRWKAARVAVLVPCFNEGATIAKVVQDFHAVLPGAAVYVFDNGSTDESISEARRARAIVRSEEQLGKGCVIRRMFSDIEADIYVLVDGDDTYDATTAPGLVDCLVQGSLDMVCGRRVGVDEGAYRRGHRAGNWLLTRLVSLFFGRRTRDLLSGYRVLSRRFVKSFPALSRGFEIETELTVHAMELQMPFTDVDVPYRGRPIGSESKLSTMRDGLKIGVTIAHLIKEERPFEFFSGVAAVLTILSLVMGYPLLTEYLETGLVPRFPTAILLTGIMVLAFLSFFSGVILATVTLGRREKKRLAYLQYEGVEAWRED